MNTRQAAALLVAAMSLPSWGYSQSLSREHFGITEQQVAQTLSNKGIQIADLRVSLLAKVVAAEPNPELDVLSVEPLGLRRSAEQSASSYMVKIGCHSDGVCLPFYAIASLNQGTRGSQTNSQSTILAAASTSSKANAAAMIKAGAHAMLIMDDGSVQIEVSVITLESGAVGNKIHVASPDHKQIYLAEVVSANLLTRSF